MGCKKILSLSNKWSNLQVGIHRKGMPFEGKSSWGFRGGKFLHIPWWDPWEWYIYLTFSWLISVVNDCKVGYICQQSSHGFVGKRNQLIDGLKGLSGRPLWHLCLLWVWHVPRHVPANTSWALDVSGHWWAVLVVGCCLSSIFVHWGCLLGE